MAGQVDSDDQWELLRDIAAGLQCASRLPQDDGLLYEPGLAVVRQLLHDGNPARARDEARKLARANKAAAFLAHELLKEYYLATGNPGRAGALAKEASRLLRACSKAEVRKLRPRRWSWR